MPLKYGRKQTHAWLRIERTCVCKATAATRITGRLKSTLYTVQPARQCWMSTQVTHESQTSRKRVANESQTSRKRVANESQTSRKRVANESQTSRKRVANESQTSRKRVANESQTSRKRVALVHYIHRAYCTATPSYFCMTTAYILLTRCPSGRSVVVSRGRLWSVVLKSYRSQPDWPRTTDSARDGQQIVATGAHRRRTQIFNDGSGKKT